MLVVIAIRNLLASRVRTLLVGFILFFGAFLLVAGNSFLDTIDRNMERSLVNSISGSFQITSSEAKDKLELFSMDSSTKDYGKIADFKKVRAALEAVPNVRAVVPMGLDYAVVATGNLLDRRLADLRNTLKAGNTARSHVIAAHTRRMVETLARDFKVGEALIDKKRMDQFENDKKNLAEATTESFWEALGTDAGATADAGGNDPYAALEFLENKIARLMPGEDLVWLQYLGTDLERFRENFDRFEKVDGEQVPAGKRGILFNKRFYEEQLKNKTARRLDEIKERLDAGSDFDGCDDCKEFIRLNRGQASSLASQLDADATTAVVKGLQVALNTPGESDPETLLKALLDMDAGNFLERYKLFYDVVVPHIRLYSVTIGDTFVLTAFGRGGYVRNVPVKVYGTFRFKGLDKSPVAGVFNLIDLTTFRELYGVTTPEKLAEVQALKAKVGVKDVDRDAAEDELFGEGAAVEETTTSQAFDEMAAADLSDARRRATEAAADRVYTQDEIDSGLVINAAVRLADPDKAAETRPALEAALASAGLAVTVIPWREAAGVVGIMILLFNVVLAVATLIFTVVALIIVNNALMMSTLQRTGEIGTMRAIGAGKAYVFSMIGLEAVLLAVVFGGAGFGAGAGLIAALSGGIPAASDILQFFAGGTVFIPVLSTKAIVIGVSFIVVSGFFSTLYPAYVATRITPREAMARQD